MFRERSERVLDLPCGYLPVLLTYLPIGLTWVVWTIWPESTSGRA